MSGTSGGLRALTLEGLDEFLASPVAAGPHAATHRDAVDATPYIDAAAVLVAFDPFVLRPTRGAYGKQARKDVIDRLLTVSEQVEAASQRGLWSLSFPQRRTAIRRMADRSALKQALDANSERPNTPVQRMFERLVHDPSIELAELSRDELAGLITALDWVEGIVNGLPSRSEVRAALTQSDLLAPMQRLAGRGFVGRERELQQLKDYVFSNMPPAAPLFVFGPGGVGKSTLLARFVLDCHKLNVPFVYVDIDRATVRPDRPESILIEAATQLQPQLDLPLHRIDSFVKEITYSMSRRDVSRQFESMGARFDAVPYFHEVVSTSDASPTRLVFIVDTFEEAQFLGQEVVWQLLEMLFGLKATDPSYRIVISGRTLPNEYWGSEGEQSWMEALLMRSMPHLLPVAAKQGVKNPPIEIIPLPMRPIDLGVLDESPARALLRNSAALAGIPSLDDGDVDALLAIVGRNPMCIKLAARLLRDEGIEKLRDARNEFLIKLKAEKIQALLYGRILYHVHGEDVRKVAYPGLVVRRINPDVIRNVLAGPCGLELNAERTAEGIFSELAKEVALVERDNTDNSLRHRVDVRRAMLADLTDHVDRSVVESIDRAAIAYYATQSGAVARGEEIYHRLRLCEADESLNQRWIPEAADQLRGAGEELPARQRLWLAEKLGITLNASVRQAASQEAWEAQVRRSAELYMESGAAESALSVLRERSERSPRSALYAVEAEALRFLGRFDEALQVARAGVDSASNAGAIDMALELLLKMVVIEETRAAFDRADRLMVEVEAVAAHSNNEMLRLHAMVTRLRVQRQLRPGAREERMGRRRDVLAIVNDDMLRKLRSHPVLLREVAAELGKEDARIAAAAIETLGVEVTSDEQARLLGEAMSKLAGDAPDQSASIDRNIEQMRASKFDPEVVRKVVTQSLTSTDTKNLRMKLATAQPRSDVLGEFRKYFRAGVENVMTKAIKS